jgi:hypothetical protein
LSDLSFILYRMTDRTTVRQYPGRKSRGHWDRTTATTEASMPEDDGMDAP